MGIIDCRKASSICGTAAGSEELGRDRWWVRLEERWSWVVKIF